MKEPILSVERLSVEYRTRAGVVPAVRDVSLNVFAGETLGLVGESGCGKSTLALALFRLLPERESRIVSGRVLFGGREVLSLSPEERRVLLGAQVGYVFQDPFSSLNPVLTLGDQVEEVLAAHGEATSRGRVLETLGQVRLQEAERVYRSYPHQISGGQRQRVALAMALILRPQLLILDEPTTALDVTTQGEILDLLDELKRELKMALLFITHNMGLVSERTDRLAVMYAGEVIETGESAALLREPLHPYTQGLLRSLPRLAGSKGRLPFLVGQPPDLKKIPTGCPFHPRCPAVFAPCDHKVPMLKPKAGRAVACHLYP